MLLEFGLTEYQARVYLALLSLGSAIASQVPQLSKVPRTRIYSTMHQLHEKGLVEIIPETPIKYRPVPFEHFLVRQIETIRGRAQHLEESKERIAEVFSAVQRQEASSQGRFEVIYGRRNVRDRVSKLYHATTKELIVVGTHTSPDRIAKAMLFSIEDKHEEGARFRFIFPNTVKNPQRLESLEPFAAMRFVPVSLPIFFVTVDGREALINHPIPNDENHIRGDDVALWTDDEGIVEGLGLLAEHLWSLGSSSAQRSLMGPLLALTHAAIGSEASSAQPAIPAMATALGSIIAARASGKDADAAVGALRAYLEGALVGTAAISDDSPLEVMVRLRMRETLSEDSPLGRQFLEALVTAVFTTVCGKAPAKVVFKELV